MAACVAGVATGTNGSIGSATTASFTPAANDLLIAISAAASNTEASPPVSDTQGLGWTLISQILVNASNGSCWLWVANALAANSSMTFTVDPVGTMNGCGICICRVSGMTRTGSAAIRQSAVLANQPSPGGGALTPPTLAGSCLTGNPTIEGIASQEGSMSPPASWTERADLTWTSGGTNEIEYHTRDSGFTGTNTGWADTLSSNYCTFLLELDTSAAAAAAPILPDPFNAIPFMR